MCISVVKGYICTPSSPPPSATVSIIFFITSACLLEYCMFYYTSVQNVPCRVKHWWNMFNLKYVRHLTRIYQTSEMITAIWIISMIIYHCNMNNRDLKNGRNERNHKLLTSTLSLVTVLLSPMFQFNFFYQWRWMVWNLKQEKPQRQRRHCTCMHNVIESISTFPRRRKL